MTDLPRVASLIFERPLLILPETALAIASNLADRLGVEPMQPPRAAISSARAAEAPYQTRDGIAFVPVRGELVNRGSWLQAASGLTSYEGLASSLVAALGDPAVRGILLDMDSPGGEASGSIETAALVRDVADRKPVVAFVNGLGASAAYAIAAGASHVVTTPSAQLGSIGVVMLHVDRTEAAAKAGLKPTLIHAGAYKVDNFSLHPLDDGARGRLQASVDAIYDLFVASVAEHRSLTQKAVRATEAGLFMGAGAVKAGLADEVGTLDDALAFFSREPSRRGATGVNLMTETTVLPAAAPVAPPPAVSPPSPTEAASAERERVQAIISAPEAKGREALAQHFAFATAMAPADAIAALALAPAAQEAAPAAPPPSPSTSRLAAVVPQPDLRPDPPAPTAAANWADIYAAENRRAKSQNAAFVIPG